MEELGANLKDLESIVQSKSKNLQVVEDGKSHAAHKEGMLMKFIPVLRQKVISAPVANASAA